MNDSNLVTDLKTALKNEGVTDPDNLAIVQVGNDSIIGELHATLDNVLKLDPVVVTNPKRFVRIQRMTPEGLNVEYAIIDFDAMTNGGQISVRPVMIYWVDQAGDDGQVNLLKMLLGYFDASRRRRAAAAGIDLGVTKLPIKPR